jgi:hypothetical protein
MRAFEDAGSEGPGEKDERREAMMEGGQQRLTVKQGPNSLNKRHVPKNYRKRGRIV